MLFSIFSQSFSIMLCFDVFDPGTYKFSFKEEGYICFKALQFALAYLTSSPWMVIMASLTKLHIYLNLN